MIIKLKYAGNVDTDLVFEVDPENQMALKISFTRYENGIINILKEYCCSIPFETDSRYNKNISISLVRCGSLVIDERFEDPFYYETPVKDLVDKICWFTLPANYNDPAGLNGLEIYVKGE